MSRSWTEALCNTHPAKFFAALALQKHSLISLQYAPRPHIRNLVGSSVIDPGFAPLTSLIRLKLEGHYNNLDDAVISDLTAPPNLEFLSLPGAVAIGSSMKNWDPYVEEFVGSPRTDDLLSAMPRLKGVELSFSYFQFYPSENQRVLEEIGERLRQRSVELRALQEPLRRGYVPPLLYGEEIEPDRLVYVNDGRGFTSAAPRRSGVVLLGGTSDSEWEYTEDDDDDDQGSEEEIPVSG